MSFPRLLTSVARRNLAKYTTLLPRATLTTTSLRLNSSSSSSRPDVPNPRQTDQGSTGPHQSTANASGPSGTVPDSQLSDPYPLPFSPDIVDLNTANGGAETGPESKWSGLNLASQRQTVEGVNAPMRVPGRETEDRDTKIARLVYQCRKRGTLETDLLLSTFAKKELKNLEDKELDELDRLLDEPDWDIFYWCTLRKQIPERWEESFKTEGKLGWRLVKHTKNEERVTRFMPDL
ncbi:hypothetical protein NDA10_005576 [Ustilago hordei]|nr:hypothetical protein NDA10_005576 [Ustilago hordei]UTT95286.1 hypothetical protein NDA17_000891 [Ustilago hordei]